VKILPTISVIIPSYGRAEALLNNVSSLLAQTHAPNEIIVIHQKPDLHNAATIRIQDFAKQSRIILHEPEFANAQKARNLGIKSASSEVLLLLDDDLQVPQDLIYRHLVNYAEDSSLDGVVGQVLDVNKCSTLEMSSSCSWPNMGWQFFPMNYSKRSSIKNWPSTNSSIRTSIARKVGGFDERFDRTWLDDTDFSCRLLKAGANLVFDPTATVTHLKIPLGGKRLRSSSSLWMDREGWATHFYFWRKNYGLWKARYHFLWNVRYLIFRKAVLVRPHWFAKNIWHFLIGYRTASQKLKEGPRYFTS
jgi:GT2 family glycosyltransferase